MKKSLFENTLNAAFGGSEEEFLGLCVQLAEEAGVTWEPEEPDLPEKIYHRPLTFLAGNQRSLACDVGPDQWRYLTDRELTAVCNTYNRLRAGELVDKAQAEAEIRSEFIRYWLMRDASAQERAGDLEREVEALKAEGESLRARKGNVQHCADRSDRLVDKWKSLAKGFAHRIDDALQYLDPSDTVYRILTGEEP